MDPFLALIIVLVAALIIAGWRTLPSRRLKLLFGASALLISSYELVPTPDTWEKGLYLWARHVPTYIGEWVFYLFLLEFGRHFIEDMLNDKQIQAAPKPTYNLPVFFFATGTSLFTFVTQEGLSHIFVLPVFMLVFALVKLRFGLSQSRYKPVLTWFITGLSCWVMIHISEFLLESQKALGALDDHVEQIEKVWLTIGIAAFMFGLQKFMKLKNAD